MIPAAALDQLATADEYAHFIRSGSLWGPFTLVVVSCDVFQTRLPFLFYLGHFQLAPHVCGRAA